MDLDIRENQKSYFKGSQEYCLSGDTYYINTIAIHTLFKKINWKKSVTGEVNIYSKELVCVEKKKKYIISGVKTLTT